MMYLIIYIIFVFITYIMTKELYAKENKEIWTLYDRIYCIAFSIFTPLSFIFILCYILRKFIRKILKKINWNKPVKW